MTVDRPITAETIVDVTGRWFPWVADHPYGVVVSIRRKEYKFLPTYLSALAQVGVVCNAGARFELDFLHEQRTRYAAVAGRLCREVPGLAVVKGEAVARLYPPGVTRFIGDIDVVAPGEEALWAAASVLHGLGWQATGVLTVRTGDRTDTVVEMTAPLRDPLMPKDMAELSTVANVGNRLGVPPLTSGWTSHGADHVRNFLAVATEGIEREFGLRDVLDAALLLRALPDDGLDAIRDGAESTLLVPEVARLLRLAARMDLVDEAVVPAAAPRRAVAAARARRGGNAVSALRRPVDFATRTVQQRFVFGDSAAAKWAWRHVSRRLSHAAATRAGVLLWGVPVERAGSTGAGAPDSANVVSTPVGLFFLTPSAEIDPRQLAAANLVAVESARPSPTPPPAGRSPRD